MDKREESKKGKMVKNGKESDKEAGKTVYTERT